MTVNQGNNIYLPPSPVTPPFLTISNITRAINAVVTVVETNTYQLGQLCYFSVPASYGMSQINALTGKIGIINGLNLTVNIDTSQFDTFVLPSAGTEQPATLSSAGSSNIYNTQYVPFHSLDGSRGN